MIGETAAMTTRMLVLSLLPLLAMPAHAHKQRVCEVVARVNGEVIKDTTYDAALQNWRQELTREMAATGEGAKEIDAELERRRPSVLDDLIDELLLAQRGKELGFNADVELQRMEEGIPPGYRDSFPQFDDALRAQGVNLAQARESLRLQALGQRAIQVEILEPIFHSITDAERRVFFYEHKDEFMLPAAVALSEVFLAFRGSSESEVAQRAEKLLVELRAGADFSKAVAENTPASRPSRDKRGPLGTLRMDELKESLAVGLAKLNPGEFMEPTRLNDGYSIIRLDERIPAHALSFEDPKTQDAVSRRIAISRSAGMRNGYIARLREKATIEICPR